MPSHHCGTEQSSPRKPRSQKHRPPTHTPCDEQLPAHRASRSHPYPSKPGAHAQTPRWHSPLPEQLRGHVAGASIDVKCATADHASLVHSAAEALAPLTVQPP